MRPILLAALVLALPATGPAHAQPTLAGDVCAWRESLSPRPQGGDEWAVMVHGGPIAAADVVTMMPAVDEVLDGNPYSVTLTCSVKLGDSDHTSPTAASATATGLGAAVLPPTDLVYLDPVGDGIGLCTEVTVTDRDGDSATFYWDVFADEFGTDPAASCGPVACATAFGCGIEIPPREVQDAVDIANQVVVEHVDPPLCAVLGGDVPDVWDCPPYA